MRAWALLLLSGLAASTPIAQPGWRRIEGYPVALDPRCDPHPRVGRLRFLAGWRLASRDPRFGGISALLARNGALLAIGDQGGLFRLVERNGQLSGQVLGILSDGPPTRGKRFGRDIEAVTSDPATGRVWLGFESWKEVWRFGPALARAESHARPLAMREWPRNGSIEALLRLPDGRFLIFCEKCDEGAVPARVLLFPGDPAVPGLRPRPLRYRQPDGYSVTDAALLPGGEVLLLQRRLHPYDGWSAILSVAPIRAFRPGALVVPQQIARLAPPLTIDNMEGLAVTREGGRTIVWIAADDNLSTLQRSLLLKFVLE